MPIDVNSYNAQFSQFVQFAGGLVAARLGQDALRSIKGALESPVAGQLQAIYTDLNNEDLVEAGVPKHEATIMKRTVSDLSSDILSLLDNVNATSRWSAKETRQSTRKGRPARTIVALRR